MKRRNRYMKIFKLSLFLFITPFFFLFACQSENIDEKIYEHLEKTADHEASLQTIREQMAQLESDEHTLYTELIDEPLDDHELIKDYIIEAERLIDERKELLEAEKEQMDLSREEFIKVEELMEQIDEKKVRQSADEMYGIMMHRYELYDEWYESYILRLEREAKMYQLFLEEKIDFEEINKQVESVNETYDKAQIILDQFSEQTESYNNAKRNFYEISSLDVVVE